MKNKYLRFINIAALYFLVFCAVFIVYNYAELLDKLKDSFARKGFVVKEIHVNELKYIELAEIIKNLDFNNGDNILSIDLEANQKRLASNFWIDSVSLKIIFPNIIEININEKNAEFILFENDQYHIIDEKGNIIKDLGIEDTKRFADFIVLTGQDAKLYAANLIEFIKSDKIIYSYISEITRVSKQRWNIKFINDMLVKLPQQDPKSAWSLFIELNNQMKFFDNKIKSIDLRVKDRLFLELDVKNRDNLKIIKEIG